MIHEDYFIFLDIDGVIADCDHRLHYVKQEKKDYDSFYKEVVNDAPMVDNDFIDQVEKRYQGRVVFVTGRPERTRKDTNEWLEKHYGVKPYSHTMLMRQDKDHRKSEELKAELVAEFASTYPIRSCAVIDNKESNVHSMVDAIIEVASHARVMGMLVGKKEG